MAQENKTAEEVYNEHVNSYFEKYPLHRFDDITNSVFIEAMKAYAEQETSAMKKNIEVLKSALKESNEREARLLKQIELKQFYTKDQVEQEREKAFIGAREWDLIETERGKTHIPSYNDFEEYKTNNSLK